MLNLKRQYFSHLMQRTDSLEKTLMLGKIEGKRRRDDRGWDGWMASPQWTWVWASSGSWWWTGKPGVLQSMGSQRAGHDWATELLWSPCGGLIRGAQWAGIIQKVHSVLPLVWTPQCCRPLLHFTNSPQDRPTTVGVHIQELSLSLMVSEWSWPPWRVSLAPASWPRQQSLVPFLSWGLWYYINRDTLTRSNLKRAVRVSQEVHWASSNSANHGSGFSRERESIGCPCIFQRYFYKMLVHMIMEAEKSHDLPSSSWRPGKAEAVVWRPVRQISMAEILFWVRSPERQEHQGREIRGPTQQTELKFKHLCLFCPLQALQQIGWIPSTLGRSICFDQSTNWDASDISSRNIFPGTSEKMFS